MLEGESETPSSVNTPAGSLTLVTVNVVKGVASPLAVAVLNLLYM